MKALLTYHATQRLAERTALSEDDLFRLLDNRRCVIVGIEPYTNRLHKLIYSEEDKSHFVAIQDAATGEVITILPLDYHENLAWKITNEKLKMAIFRTSPSLYSSLCSSQVEPSAQGIKCNITVFIHSPGLRAIRRNFGSYRFSELPSDADEAIGNPGFIEKLLQRFGQRQVAIESVEEIHLTDQKHDYLLKVPWELFAYFQNEIEVPQPP